MHTTDQEPLPTAANLREFFKPVLAYFNGMVDGAVTDVLRVVAGGKDADDARLGWHDKLEDQVVAQGRELQRQLLQAILNARKAAEPRHAAIIGPDHVKRTHHRDVTCALVTQVGEVVVPRVAYSAPEMGALIPLDAALSLPAGRYSHGIKRECAVEAIRGSFEEAQGAVERHTGVAVPKRQILDLVRDAACDFEQFYAIANGPLELPDEASLLILSCDGKGVVMRPEGLRDATRQAAAEQTHKLGGRLSKGEKKNRKRMASVAAVYGIAPHVRAAEEVMDPGVDKRVRPRPVNKRVWARLDVELDQVVKDLFDEAEHRDPGHRRRWVVLVDGANHQLKLVRHEARRRHVEVTIVVDFIHVLEYLWKAAWDFFAEGDAAAEQWVTERALEVLRGKAPFVAAGIRRSATLRELSKRDNADTCADYLLAKKAFLRYDIALANGLPIATGVIEGACRHLVKDRMDITGARWGLDGGEAIMRLRSLWSSGDFGTYWEFHLSRTHDRNHPVDYTPLAA